MPMKEYTLTVRQVMENLASLAESYEKVSRGGSPTGNYFFSINVADMAASLKAAQALICRLPILFPVAKQLPGEGVDVLAWLPTDECYCIGHLQNGYWVSRDKRLMDYPAQGDPEGPTHWIPLPEQPGEE